MEDGYWNRNADKGPPVWPWVVGPLIVVAAIAWSVAVLASVEWA